MIASIILLSFDLVAKIHIILIYSKFFGEKLNVTVCTVFLLCFIPWLRKDWTSACRLHQQKLLRHSYMGINIVFPRMAQASESDYEQEALQFKVSSIV